MKIQKLKKSIYCLHFFLFLSLVFFDKKSAAEDGTTRSKGKNHKEDLILSESTDSIQDTLSWALYAMVSPRKFDDLVELFTEKDRKRIGEFRHERASSLEQEQRRLLDHWKTHYHTSFAIGDLSHTLKNGLERRVFNFQYTLNPKHKQVTVNLYGDLPKEGILILVHEGFAKDLIREGWARGRWRIDICDTLSGPTLRQTLQDKLTEVNSNVDKWPLNEIEGYQFLARRLLSIVTINSSK